MSSAKSTTFSRAPILPDRIRRVDEGGFAFIPNRFFRDGFFASLKPAELRLYVLLVLLGDRRGVSYYSFEHICSILEVTLDDYLPTRNALIDKDLVAFDGTRHQVLSLPSRPKFDAKPALRTNQDLEDHDPATIRLAVREALERLAADDDDDHHHLDD
jgi:hypothetical protein